MGLTDLLVLDLVDKGLVTNQLVLNIGYDIENLTDPKRAKAYHGDITVDHYGRKIPKHAHGTVNLEKYTSSGKEIIQAVIGLFERIVNHDLLIRRLNITAAHVLAEDAYESNPGIQQMNLFEDPSPSEDPIREKRRQQAVLTIRKKYGKNAILKGMNLEEGATAKDRNSQIGGHKA